MEIVKPGQLGISFRSIEYRKRFGLCASAILHVPFDQGATGALWGEQSLWNFLSAEMASPLIDEGVSKLTPEFLVHGRVFPPADQPAACAVRVRLAGVEKTVLAFGDRFWDGRQISAPVPIDTLALDWSQAYGGADFAANLAGKGRKSDGGVQWLPNLELPSSRVLHPDQTVEPAGLGPLDVMHPQRAALRGTYDVDYLKAHSPGFPPDLEWKHFNMACADQWLPSPLRGDEPFALDHLHPSRPHIEGSLPGLRVRMFAEYLVPVSEDDPEGVRLREIPMRLTTVWFFPHALRMALVFHGLAESAEDDGADIKALLGGVERLDDVRSSSHYVEVLQKRRDPKYGDVESLNDHDLLPQDIDIADPAFEQAKACFHRDDLQGQAQFRKAEAETLRVRQLVASQGKDPDAMGIHMPRREAPPPAAELPAYLKAKRAEMEARQWDEVDDLLTHIERIQAMVSSGELKPKEIQALLHRGPPLFRAEAQWQQLQRVQGQPLAESDQKKMRTQLAQREFAERVNYLQTAHLQPPAFPLVGERARNHRDDTVWMLAQGMRTLQGMDLTGADLSALDLRGVDFSGAWLESANLSHANISGANFTAAVLAHADMRDSIAIGADFTSANLGRASMAGAVFDEAQFLGAMLTGCNFDGTQCRGARMGGAAWLDTQWGRADWSGVQAPDATFYKFDLRGMNFSQANLAGATLIECNLEGADLRGARLERATFVTCNLTRAQLGRAVLDGAAFTLKSNLVDADLREASLASVNLGDTDLSGARLIRARLDGASLPNARLDGCDARLASAQGALMKRVGLRGAQLAGVNFKDAILQHADLRGADLRSANLFGADLSRVRLDGDVQLDNALLKRARTWPRRTPEQQAAP